jgi:hypothetical protein
MRTRRTTAFASTVASAGAVAVLAGCVPFLPVITDDGGADRGSGPPGNLLLPDDAIICTTPAPDATPDAAVAIVEANAMPSDEFWQYIELLDGTNSPEGYTRLETELAKADLATVIAFDARLTLALHALDSDCRAEWYRLNEPAQFGFVSDDGFLYARADTVSAGRATWEEAVATQTLPWGGADPLTGTGEFLLYVGLAAAELQGVTFDEYLDRRVERVPLSYETGSNPLGWGG